MPLLTWELWLARGVVTDKPLPYFNAVTMPGGAP